MAFLVQVIKGELDLLAIQKMNPGNYPFLLDSAAHGYTHSLNTDEQGQSEFHEKPTALGRYSILFAFPQKQLVLDAQWRLSYNGGLEFSSASFLDALDEVWQLEASVSQTSLDKLQHLPFKGGWFLFLAYELANQVEPVLDLENVNHSPASGLPVAFASRIPVAIVVDHVTHESTVFAEQGYSHEFAYLLADIEKSKTEIPVEKLNQITAIHEEAQEKYLSAIKQTREYLRNGDIFQANLSREWQAEFNPPVDTTSLYSQLRASNPGPFAGLVYHDSHVIMSSSPERLLQISDGQASTRPIAGTRPRGTDVDDDKLLREELLKHPKERAEHIMLIDLERNDLGRICQAGSVVVDELMVIETYEHVHHIVSNVSGKLRNDVSPGQAIKAVFPGGTITGCPKVRCMQIIAELEEKPREAYTGSMGYLNHTGDLDLNILIRTMHLHTNGLTFRAGGGIVFDSNPEKEVHETRAKARGLIHALESQGEA